MGTPATGARSRMLFDTALPFDTSSKAVEFESNTIQKKGVILSTDGLRGSRQFPSERTREGAYPVNGTLTMPASPLMLDFFLPVICGGALTAGVVKLAETLPKFYLMEDKVTDVFTWSSIAVNKATFRAQLGKTLMLALDLEAETESIGGSYPAVSPPIDSPYVLSDAALTIGGTSRLVSEIELVIDNMLITDRFENSLTRTDFPSQGVMVSLNTSHPYTSDEQDLYDVALNGFDSATLVFTNADVNTNVLTITFGRLQIPTQTPQTNGRGETRLPLAMVARKIGTVAGTTDAIKFQNAHA